MPSKIVDERDQRFVLNEVMGLAGLCHNVKWGECSPEMFDMILTEAQKLSEKVVYPILAEGDREGCHLVDGTPRVPKCFHKAYQTYRDGGWPELSVNRFEHVPTTYRAIGDKRRP